MGDLDRTSARIRREALLLPKFSRHYKSPSRGRASPRNDPAALAMLHSLRTGTRPPPHPPRDTKKTELSPRRQAVTSLGFRESSAAAARRSNIVFSSDDEGIFAAGSSLLPGLRETVHNASPVHQTTLQFLGTKVAVFDLCSTLSSGTCAALHTLKMDACPIGLTAVGDILKASHSCAKLTTISMNSMNGSKRCPLTLPAKRGPAGEAIARALMTHPSLVFACMRNNGLGATFALTLERLVTEQKGARILSTLDISGNPGVGTIATGAVACYVRELRMAYANLHGSRGAQVVSALVESAENHALAQKNSKSHPLALFDCAFCGLGDAAADPIFRLMTCSKLTFLTAIDVSRNRLEAKAASSIAEALATGTHIRSLKAGYQFFGLEGTLSILEACVTAPSIKHVYLENTAPTDKQQVWERSIYLLLIDCPSLINVVVEWPPKKPGRFMQTGLVRSSTHSENGFQHRMLACDGDGLFCIPAAGVAAFNDIAKSNIDKLCSNQRQIEALEKLLASHAIHLFSIFQNVCLEQKNETPFGLLLNGWGAVVRKCAKTLAEADEDSMSSSDSDEDEDDGKPPATASRIFKACRFRIVDNCSTTPSLERPQWLEALVRLSMLHFRNDSPATAASRFLENGLFKSYSSVAPPDFWRKKNLYDRADVEILFTKRLKTRQVLLDIFLRYAHGSGSEAGQAFRSPRGLTFSRWKLFLRQFKLFDGKFLTKASAKFPFVYSLPLSIDADEHRSGFKATELAFSGFLEAVARAGEMVSEKYIELKTECLHAFLAQKEGAVEGGYRSGNFVVDAAVANDTTALGEGVEETEATGKMDAFSRHMHHVLEYVQLKAQTVL
jgi:hypothetical protein